MPTVDVLYRHTGVALLRAAVTAADDAPKQWPDLTDPASCRDWLEQVWSRGDLAEPIRLASPSLSQRIEAIRCGRAVAVKQVRRATLAAARYVLRATGRPTPFGLFAGVAPVEVAKSAGSRWGSDHRSVARPDTQWLADLITRLEGIPELLSRLDVAVTNLATVRGGTWRHRAAQVGSG